MSDRSFSNPKPELNIPSLGDGVDAVLIDEIQLDFTGSEEESLRVVSSIEETTGTVNIDFVVIHGLFGKELNRDRWFDCGPDSWLTQYANSLKSNSRIIEFKYNASVIVDGDSEETISGIRQVALSLLNKLKDLRRGEVTRTIMFLGRGIGGIIVKDALVAASTGMGDWDDILDCSRVLLFSDCPHKSRDRNRLENSLCYTLFATRPDFSQSASPLFFTGSLISKLASEVMEVNASFILSKLHLRSHLISIYEERKKADYVDDHLDNFYNYTIGVPFERRLARSEEDTHKSSVLDHLDDLKECIIPLHESRLRHERLLLSLATSLPPLIAPLNETWWLKDHTKYKQWLDSPETQLLYLHGNLHDVIQEAAAQAFYHLEQVQRTRDKKIPVLFFEFDSWDARRCSLSHMLSTFIAQLTCHYPNWKNRIEYMSYCVEQERCWTFRDLMSWFELFNHMKQSIVISRFDECEIESRRAFLDLISYTAQMSEWPWKIVVTSGTSAVLLEELGNWPEIDIIAQSPEDSAGSMQPQNTHTHRENMMLHKRLSCFPTLDDHDRSIIVKHLAARKIPLLKTQLWGVLSSVKVEDSEEILESVLDSYFRGIPEQHVAKCALMWLLHSKRPLSNRELAEIMFLESEGDHGNYRSPDPLEVDNFVVKLELWFAGFIEVENDEVFVRNGRLREIFGNPVGRCSNTYLWTEASEDAHLKIAKTCLKYLSLPDTEINLKIPNGTMSGRNPRLCLGNLLSYAVKYWFQHFQSAKDSQNYPLEILIGLIQNIDLESWSRMFWELSSPITRSPSPWESPFPIFAGQGEIDLVKSKNDEDFRAGLVEASLNGRQSTVQRMLDIHECPAPILLNAIQSSAAGGHEQLAIDLLGRLPTETKLSIQHWGTNILWRSARANLHRLADTVLSMGCGPDPEAKHGTEWNTTPLSQCSINGHLEMTKVLVKHKANVEFPSFKNRTPLALAASRGHANVVRFLATQANAKIDAVDVGGCRPIDKSCVWGNQEVVMELLRLEPDMKLSSDDPILPLVVAALNGNDRCVELLLGYAKADKDISSRLNIDLALLYAARFDKITTCRTLLDYGANINANVHRFSPFTVAVKAGNEEIVKLLLDHRPRPDVNLKDGHGRTALYNAVLMQNVALIRLLLDNDCDPDVPVNGPYVALHSAVTNNEITEMLARKTRNFEARTPQNLTALMLAAERNEESARILIEHKADVNAEVPLDSEFWEGWTPMFFAANANKPTAVTLLAEAGADLKHRAKDGKSALHLAVDGDALSALMEFHSQIDLNQPDNQGYTPLHMMGSLTLRNVQYLVRGGAKINIQADDGCTPLQVAVRRNENNAIEIVSYLLEHGANPNLSGTEPGKDDPPLHHACDSLSLEISKLLVENGADVNKSSIGPLGTPLIATCLRGFTQEDSEGKNTEDLIRYLLEKGADINGTHSRWGCVFGVVSMFMKPKIVSLLLEEGASIHTQDFCGRLPIHLAAFHGGKNLDIVIEAGGDVTAKDKLGRTALHYACQAGRSSSVKKLLDLVGEENANETDIDGWTPLHWAVRGTGNMIEEEWLAGEAVNEIETIRILIERGANRSAQYHVRGESWSPLRIANYRGADDTVIALLKNSGGPNEDEGLGGTSSENFGQYGANVSSPKKAYRRIGWTCDACLWGMWGLCYKCNVCLDLAFCVKCYDHRDIVHAEFPDHAFKEHGPEFEHDDSKSNSGEITDDDSRSIISESSGSEPEENTRNESEEPEELVVLGNDHEQSDSDENADSSESEDDN
ncbi:uncharacterized protein EAE98_001856 [Botrytis deweyae]|uniref:ZZ-type domain-containing protein n=1 Tax=Botrytis deweyae TaxID=2478750 RepID=A0ABQ7IZJ3_9HELO|nr:uncharacterized protein EAE98_001856 [Botrytis deweyae]KAF7937542.1 hypothetical protein EAE98_001856 [Botrytis deweyae]